MISFVFVLLLNIFSPLPKQSGPLHRQEAEVVKSKFIVFSGSDWCKGCIQFRKKVLTDPVFETFAKENLEIVVADFPQRTKLASDIVKQNEALAEKYNPQGAFPTLVLLSSDGLRSATIEYNNQTPQEFLSELKMQLGHLNE